MTLGVSLVAQDLAYNNLSNIVRYSQQLPCYQDQFLGRNDL